MLDALQGKRIINVAFFIFDTFAPEMEQIKRKSRAHPHAASPAALWKNRIQ
jgi:hypothetical protein